MTDFGNDISVFPDLDPSFALKTGAHVIGEAVARRLVTPRGGLIYDLNYGFNLRDFLNASLSTAQLRGLEGSVEIECGKDERVLDATATVTLNTQTQKLDVSVVLTTSAGPFTLLLAVGNVTVDVLKNS